MVQETTDFAISKHPPLRPPPLREEARLERATACADYPPNLYEYNTSFLISLTSLCLNVDDFISASLRRIQVSTDMYNLIY